VNTALDASSSVASGASAEVLHASFTTLAGSRCVVSSCSRVQATAPTKPIMSAATESSAPRFRFIGFLRR
jgi:hypothetical protein